MNKVILMGRLTRDPQVNYSQNQDGTSMAIARYTLAVARRTRDNEADFIGCVAFGRAAEFTEKYLSRGIKVIVTGSIRTGSYTDRDGKKVYTTDVIVEEQEFAESKNASTNTTSQENGQNTGTYTDADGFMQIPDGVEDEGLPFD